MRIGIFDSGAGGLSVMQAIRRRLPQAELLYVADTGHAPYGDRTEAFIGDRTERVTRFLCEQGAQIVVIACNTATTAAVAALRASLPALPVVGVEPGIKPAVALSVARRIGVLATTRTLTSDRFLRVAQAHADGATLVLQACPGLADTIDRPDVRMDELDVLIDQHCAPLRAEGVDVAVLGCTHYIFARELFERALPGVRLVETAEAVAEQTARLACQLGRDTAVPPGVSHQPSEVPLSRAWSSGPPEVLAAFARRWLNLDITVEPMRC